MTFAQLAVGQHFRFSPGGSLLVKSSARHYDAPQWDRFDTWVLDMERTVLPHEAGNRPLAGDACLSHLEPEPCPTCAAYIAAGL